MEAFPDVVSRLRMDGETSLNWTPTGSQGDLYVQEGSFVHFGASKYSDWMSDMTLSDARSRLADVVDQARVEHEPVFLTRRGRRVAAVIDVDQLSELIAAAEDLEDLRAVADARAEMEASGEGAIPWEQVKADLGLV